MKGGCDYSSYYKNQAGSGTSYSYSLPVYRGRPLQQGFGFWSKLFKRYGMPMLSYAGKQLFNTGKNVVSDIVEKEVEPKQALKRRFKEVGKKTAVDSLRAAASHLEGSGRKRRRVVKKRKTTKKSTLKPRKKAKPKKNKSIKTKTKKKKRPTDIFS